MSKQTNLMERHTNGRVGKLLGIPLEKNLTKTEKGTLLVKGYFTSDNRDEVGDIITRAATERAIPKYRQWGNIRLMHQPVPVGVIRGIGVEDGLEWNQVDIEVIDPNAIFMVENGLLKALSVGILVNYEDIDFLEDGGYIINDYTLAEISLVDHPANYDALLNLSIDQGLRQLAHEHGLENIARSMKTILELELAMEEETMVEAPEVPAEETPAEEVAPEEPVEIEASLETEEEAPVAEEPAEPVAEVDEQPAVDPMLELASAIKGFTAAVESLQRSLEARAEAPSAMERSLSEEETAEETAEEEAQAQEEEPVAEETPAEEVIEAGLPADRPGGLPETELSLEPEEGQPANEYSVINRAITGYLTRKGVRIKE